MKTEAELEDAQRRLNEEEESRQRLNEEKTELQVRCLVFLSLSFFYFGIRMSRFTESLP